MHVRMLVAITILGGSAMAARAQAIPPRPLLPVTASVIAPAVRTIDHPEHYDLGRALARLVILRRAPFPTDDAEFVLDRASAVGSIVLPGWIERAIGGDNVFVEGVRFVRRPILLAQQPVNVDPARERDKLLVGISFLAARAIAQHRLELRFRIPLR